MTNVKSQVMMRQLNFLNSVLKRPDSLVYQAWWDNTFGEWDSPLKKLWLSLKSESYTYGEFTKSKVKERVMALENISIERNIQDHSSLT